MATAAAARVVDVWTAELEGGTAWMPVAVNASGCGTVVKDYARVLESDPPRRGRAAALAAMVRDVTELLAPEDLRLPETAVPLTVCLSRCLLAATCPEDPQAAARTCCAPPASR